MVDGLTGGEPVDRLMRDGMAQASSQRERSLGGDGTRTQSRVNRVEEDQLSPEFCRALLSALLVSCFLLRSRGCPSTP